MCFFPPYRKFKEDGETQNGGRHPGAPPPHRFSCPQGPRSLLLIIWQFPAAWLGGSGATASPFRRNGITVPAQRHSGSGETRKASRAESKLRRAAKGYANTSPDGFARPARHPADEANIIFPLQGFCSLRLYVPPRLFSAAFLARFSPPKSPVFGTQNTPPSCGLRFAAANISPISPLLAEIMRIQSFIGSKWKVDRKGRPHEVKKHAHVRGSHMRMLDTVTCGGCRPGAAREDLAIPTGATPFSLLGLDPVGDPDSPRFQLRDTPRRRI